jgi:hypothetical protein
VANVKINNRLFGGIVMTLIGFYAAIAVAEAATGYNDQKIKKLEAYQQRQIAMEALIARQMNSGMGFEESYLAAKEQRTELSKEVIQAGNDTSIWSSRPLRLDTSGEVAPDTTMDDDGAVASVEEEFARSEQDRLLSSEYSRLEGDFPENKDFERDDLMEIRKARLAQARQMANDYTLEKEMRRAAADDYMSAFDHLKDYDYRDNDLPFDESHSEGMEASIAERRDGESRQSRGPAWRDRTLDEMRDRFDFEGEYKKSLDVDYSQSELVDSEKDIPVQSHLKGKRPHGKTLSVLTPRDIMRQVIAPEAQDQQMDLHFDQANLGDILMTLGETGSVNIVLDPTLYQNKLDLHLKKVSLEDALMLLANIYDLGFERVGDSLFIAHKDKLREKSLESRVFKLKATSKNEVLS